MADPFYSIEFAGLDATTGNATVTLSYGYRPSVFTIEVGLETSARNKVGDLRMTRNGSTVVRFRNCVISGVTKASGVGGLSYRVKIKDRRWKWEKGGSVVNGHYNARKPDGTVIDETHKQPRELAEMLLEKLGERNPDVSGLPNNVRKDECPEAYWDHERPGPALGRLCDAPLPGRELFDTAEDRFGNVSRLESFVEGTWYDNEVRGNRMSHEPRRAVAPIWSISFTGENVPRTGGGRWRLFFRDVNQTSCRDLAG